MNNRKKFKKILILGSGGLKIGQAGEFDYSGSQAIKALKEEGVETILVNPNIATIQTSEGMADKIYFLPLNVHFVSGVIKKERPDGILLSFGGQTALNTGLDLYDQGILKKYKVQVLGTPIETVRDTEDRALFDKRLKEINVKTARSEAVKSVAEGIKAAKRIGFPIMIRAAFALGGQGSGVCNNIRQCREKLKIVFASSPQVLIEESLTGWKEIEYEVVRDVHDNCITVCNMENFDPMGIHTGESIVVAPSQTLNNWEYHFLREIAIKTIRHLGIIGECNIQYAFNPKNGDYRIIEINARLSRSSALASKATGYPLAFVAAKLAIGYSLAEVKNSITKVTVACFEPALDYIVVKIPRWDLAKFKEAERKIGTEMKSVGEVMGIGRSFEEALQKALRMLNIGVSGFTEDILGTKNFMEAIKNPTDRRIFALAQALKADTSIKKIYNLSKIDPWFLGKLKNITKLEKELKNKKLTSDLLLKAKKLGFSDVQLANILKKPNLEVRKLRLKYNIRPKVKQIDTLAAEYPAKTNYLYLTYNGEENDVKPINNLVITLGGGPYRIGSSVEFDWCAVNAIETLSKLGFKTAMVNCNPETVSTDYDTCDRLYFEELSFERIMDIYEFENPKGMILSVGGQTPNDLAKDLFLEGVNVFGTSPLSIDRAENRFKFSKLCDEIKVSQPSWRELSNKDDAQKFAQRVGFPVLVRPSYVLSGSAMNVAFDEASLNQFLEEAAIVSRDYPVVISKFIEGAKEIEIDGVASGGRLLIYAITEHIENAGVHSGDATVVLPPQRTYLETIRRIKKITKEITQKLKITGPFNIQFLAKNNDIKVIECNLRASRSFPFVSKGSKYNFIDLAVKAMFGEEKYKDFNTVDLDYVVVKAPQFSFSRLRGADPVLSVEMSSTGEVACFGDDIFEATLKAVIATGLRLPKKNILFSIGKEENKIKLFNIAQRLYRAGYNIFATEHTSEFLKERGVKNTKLYKISSRRRPNILEYLNKDKLDLAIVIPAQYKKKELRDRYLIRRRAVDFNIPLISNLQLARVFSEAILRKKIDDLLILDWQKYNNYEMPKARDKQLRLKLNNK
jgi:carbamoyl-phosphate synthase large subunit